MSLRLGRNSRLDLSSIILAALILWFAGVHLHLWLQHRGVFVGLGQVALELVQGYLFIIRRRDMAGRRPFQVWAATSIGSWGFLAARPAGAGYFDAPWLFGAGPVLGMHTLWLALQLIGSLMAIVSLSSLGRSFGLLAANRGVRTRGAYRIIRHPAYASYFVVETGYVLENLSFWNLAVFAIVIIAQLTRIHQEEATLAQDPTYRSYMEQVPYRLLPGIY